MAHAQIQVEPYTGAETENFRQFEQLFRGFIEVAGIDPGQRSNFLQLHLRSDALRYFQNLPDATRRDVDLSLQALKDRFCHPQLQEVHILRLEKEHFDPKKDSPENFLVKVQQSAMRAYPTPTPPAVAPINAAAPDAVVEQTRFDRETATRATTIRTADENRNEQVKRIFIKSMPGWLRSKLMEQPPATPVQDLCTLARKLITIRDMCKIDDYPEDGFNEVSEKVNESLINALAKISATQDAMEKRMRNGSST